MNIVRWWMMVISVATHNKVIGSGCATKRYDDIYTVTVVREAIKDHLMP